MMFKESAMLNGFLLACCSIITAIVPFAGGNPTSCPPRAIKTAMQCTSQLSFIGQSTSVVGNDLPDRLIDGCRYGTFMNSVTCIEGIMTKCKDDTSEAAKYFRASINIEKMRRGIEYFCSHVQDYTDNSDCIKSHMTEVSNCSKDAKQNYVNTFSTTPDKDLRTKSHCSFFSKAVSCMVNTMSDRCQWRVGNIINNVMQGFEPPVCAGSISYSIVTENVDGTENVGGEKEEISQEDNGNGSSTVSFPSIWMNFAIVISSSMLRIFH